MDFTVSCPNVWRLFEEICSIPHPSGYEEKLGAWVVQQAKANGLKARRDKVGNIIIDDLCSFFGKGACQVAGCTVISCHIELVGEIVSDKICHSDASGAYEVYVFEFHYF